MERDKFFVQMDQRQGYIQIRLCVGGGGVNVQKGESAKEDLKYGSSGY